MSGFSNRPRILKGAFVEYGLSIPPLVVVFQFNPVQLQRNRSLSFSAPNEVVPCRTPGEGDGGEMRRMERPRDLRAWHSQCDDLSTLREQQIVSVQEETVAFELRLDATDGMETGNVISQGFGVAPQLATLELMTHPKGESLLGEALGALLGGAEGFSFTRSENPPLVLFVWGVQKVLPVNIQSLAITETEFNILLNPIRATVAVNLTVIEGQSGPYLFSKSTKEIMSVLNLANLVTDIVVPG